VCDKSRDLAPQIARIFAGSRAGARNRATMRPHFFAKSTRARKARGICIPVMSEKEDDPVATGIRFPRELHDRARREAKQRATSINHLVVNALEYYLDRLPPIEPVEKAS